MANKTNHPGITRHARQLGVSYGHLRQVVITKEVERPELLAKYEKLVAAERLAEERNAKRGGATMQPGDRFECEPPLTPEQIAQLSPFGHMEGHIFVVEKQFALVPLAMAPEAEVTAAR